MVQQCLGCDARVPIFNVGDDTRREVKLRGSQFRIFFPLNKVNERRKQEANGPLYLGYVDCWEGYPKQVAQHDTDNC